MQHYVPTPSFLRFATACVASTLTAMSVAGDRPDYPDERPTVTPSNVALRVDSAGRLVDDAGSVVSLRGVNLGNWFLIEPWMYGQFDVPDEATFLAILSSRFGEANADRLLELHRDGWITQRDMDGVAAAGFNAVRIPFRHTLIEAEPFTINENGMDRLRTAINMASQAGLYVLLDMHGAPGGQSTDGPSGDRTQNALWTDADAQERFIWLWERIAREFKNQPALIGYDLLNEPYGNFVDDISPQLIDITARAVDVIRAVDPDRMILLPATLNGFRFYGDPAVRGWASVGFTEHFYPGLFDGQEASMGAFARFLAAEFRDRDAYCDALGAPFILGEFNPVFDRAGAPQAVRETFDAATDLESHAFVWAYKLLKSNAGVQSDNWYTVTNAQSLGLGDIRTSPFSVIETVLEQLPTMSLSTDTEYAQALTAPAIDQVLPDVADPPLVPPFDDAWTFWDGIDIGSVAIAGGQRVIGARTLDADGLTIYAAGMDLFGGADSFRLIGRTAPPSFTVSGIFDAFDANRFGQIGVTARASDAANAAHVSLLAFRDGRVLVKSRNQTGFGTGQRYLTTAGFPMGLGLQRSGGSFTAWITDDAGIWRSYSLSETANLGTSPIAGFFGLANREGPLTEVAIADPGIRPIGSLAQPPSLDMGVNLLTNASFESPASPSLASLAAGWSRSDAVISRETGWTPLRDGSALLAYRHWQAGGSPEDASQLVSGLTPGETYEWTVYANRDAVATNTLADRIELRVETVAGPRRWVETVRYDVSEIATASNWSRLQVRFTATQPQHRVRLVCYPNTSGGRDGAVKFDSFFLRTAE